MRMVAAAVVGDAAETAGGGGRRVEESDGGDRVDPVVVIDFGIGRKSPPEKFSGGSNGGQRRRELAGEVERERECNICGPKSGYHKKTENQAK
ncbi:hypothetical protein Tco_1101447 [Tanacetum coccineum]